MSLSRISTIILCRINLIPCIWGPQDRSARLSRPDQLRPTPTSRNSRTSPDPTQPTLYTARPASSRPSEYISLTLAKGIRVLPIRPFRTYSRTDLRAKSELRISHTSLSPLVLLLYASPSSVCSIKPACILPVLQFEYRLRYSLLCPN